MVEIEVDLSWAGVYDRSIYFDYDPETGTLREEYMSTVKDCGVMENTLRGVQSKAP